MSAEDLIGELDLIKSKRKQGELSPIEFYRELLKIAVRMAQELGDEDISEEDAKKQTPIVLTFIEDQLKKMKYRGA